jgi:signal peptidase II
LTQAASGGKTQRSVGGADDGAQPAQNLRPAGRTSTVAKAMTVLGAVAVVMIALDQWTKQLALSNLSDGSVPKVLGGLIYLDLTRNPGAAFSMGTGFTFIFPIIAIVVVVGILWFSRGLRSWPWAVAFGLLLGGAAGNLIDRLFREPGPFRGHVVDFISVFAPAAERFPIFNIADSSLSVGVVLAIALEVFGVRRDGTRLVGDTGTRRAAGSGTGD